MPYVPTPMQIDTDKNGMQKHKTGKVPMSLVPLRIMKKGAMILQHGQKKYAEGNWKNIDLSTTSPIVDSILRHLTKIEECPPNKLATLVDAESGHPHEYHILANAIFLGWARMKAEDEAEAEAKAKAGAEAEPKKGNKL